MRVCAFAGTAVAGARLIGANTAAAGWHDFYGMYHPACVPRCQAPGFYGPTWVPGVRNHLESAPGGCYAEKHRSAAHSANRGLPVLKIEAVETNMTKFILRTGLVACRRPAH